MAATPWRNVGAAAAGPSAATVSSTPSHRIDGVLIGPTIAEKSVVFQAYLFQAYLCTFDQLCRRTATPSRRPKNGWTWNRSMPSTVGKSVGVPAYLTPSSLPCGYRPLNRQTAASP